MKDTVAKFANEVILPKVRDMDEAEKMDPELVEQLFEQGLMGIEIPEEFGGAGMNFTAAIAAIEELARVDPSVSVMVDVHNTLVNTALLNWGSTALKKKYLPALATKTVGSFCLSEPVSGSVRPKQPSASPEQMPGMKRCFCSSVPHLAIAEPTSEVLTAEAYSRGGSTPTRISSGLSDGSATNGR